jgi:uncharacterized protein (TIGR03067 family)
VAVDLDRLQGAWHVTSLETDGVKTPALALGAMTIVISGNRFTSTGAGQTYEGTVKLSRAGNLKAIDLLFTAGPQRGTKNKGIYRLDGDRWTICLATNGGKRPAKFATAKDSGLALEILNRGEAARTHARRDSKRAAALRADTIESAAPATELEGDWAMVSGVFNGTPMDAAMVAWCRRVTRGDVTAVFAGPQVMLKARFTIGPSKVPPTIDYVNLAGQSTGKAQAGIYDLRSGVLRICMAAPGKPRPADFGSTRGDGRTFTTWRAADAADAASLKRT